jgi:hypothetical protein
MIMDADKKARILVLIINSVDFGLVGLFTLVVSMCGGMFSNCNFGQISFGRNLVVAMIGYLIISIFYYHWPKIFKWIMVSKIILYGYLMYLIFIEFIKLIFDSHTWNGPIPYRIFVTLMLSIRNIIPILLYVVFATFLFRSLFRQKK